jgi:hypothetical protein
MKIKGRWSFFTTLLLTKKSSDFEINVSSTFTVDICILKTVVNQLNWWSNFSPSPSKFHKQIHLIAYWYELDFRSFLLIRAVAKVLRFYVSSTEPIDKVKSPWIYRSANNNITIAVCQLALT